MYFSTTSIGLLALWVQSSLQQAAPLRTTTDFNPSWLFHYGDATGAEASTYADSTWRSLSVPHDYSIEGPSPPSSPFLQNAPSTGYGGYVPAGVSWYRKHFSLEGTDSSRRVFIEFDGVMEDANTYVNGKLIGFHPYGYTSFRYDITSAVSFTGDNVLAVKTDTSKQPGERFYKGSGIHRDVRLIVTSPVHIDQYGVYVNSSDVSTTSGTVNAQVTVLNSGSGVANVSVQHEVRDPSGAVKATISAAPQTVAAGARSVFTVNTKVSNPQLWDTENPNLYSLVTTVIVNGSPADDTTTTFGIRSLTFTPNGMFLNGKSLKLKGVCLHQDYHGLGLVGPKRAIQRRLQALKSVGSNAIRTAHDPPSPAFLDLTDRMGFLVLDEFFDVWIQKKYQDVGDYSRVFNTVTSGNTGTPPVPKAGSSTKWYEVDVTSIVSRDRNHPSVALYSTGNEIHDSINTRTPLLRRMKEIVNALDPGRAVTQALLQPGTAGDNTGATRTIVDVYGANYRQSEVLAAAKAAPARAGLDTEETKGTDKWDIIKNNAAMTGLFLWTGVDHLGEANGKWPTVGNTPGFLDAVGGFKSSAYQWQAVWGGSAPPAPATGTTASALKLESEIKSVSTDLDDLAYVKASVVDGSGKIVTSSTASITFSISGPGVIVAVDSGSQVAESFRGNTRKAFSGLAYALVRATGAGTITVTAQASGLTGASATIEGNTAPFAL